MNRKIGEFIGKERGPLIIGIGGIHGNEIAGIEALEIVLAMLENEPTKNPDFNYKGKFIAIYGNLQAIDASQRYIDKDLNRNFIKSRLDKLSRPEYAEDYEAFQIIDLIKEEIDLYQPEDLIIIDIHTTSSTGGIFSIIPDDPGCLEIALSMHAPIIKGMTEGVTGTIMDYFNSETLGVNTKTLTFEAGQHFDPNAVTIAIAAIVAALRKIGSVKASDVESRHDQVLINYSRNLPNITKLVMKHTIDQSKSFKMLPGYINFQEVKQGEVVALNDDGPIKIKEDGLILMPLYQDQGEDGFFLIKRVENYEFH
jgi:succinylglutamate desuccinylase